MQDMEPFPPPLYAELEDLALLREEEEEILFKPINSRLRRLPLPGLSIGIAPSIGSICGLEGLVGVACPDEWTTESIEICCTSIAGVRAGNKRYRSYSYRS